MRLIALRGATTVEANAAEPILHATEELMGELLARNRLEAVGHPVISLERVRFGPLWLGKLEEGRHRRLTAVEIEKLNAATRMPASPSRRRLDRNDRRPGDR